MQDGKLCSGPNQARIKQPAASVTRNVTLVVLLFRYKRPGGEPAVLLNFYSRPRYVMEILLDSEASNNSERTLS